MLRRSAELARLGRWETKKRSSYAVAQQLPFSNINCTFEFISDQRLALPRGISPTPSGWRRFWALFGDQRCADGGLRIANFRSVISSYLARTSVVECASDRPDDLCDRKQSPRLLVILVLVVKCRRPRGCMRRVPAQQRKRFETKLDLI